MSEFDALDPAVEKLTLSSGTEVEFEALKTRQFFRMLRILTHGAGHVIFSSDNFFSGESEEWVGKLLGALFYSIPESIDETIDFIQSMVKPVGLLDPMRKLDKAQKAHNEALWIALFEELANPELEDLIDIVEVIFKREADDLQALGKKLQKMFKVAAKTGQLTPQQTGSQPSQDQSTLEDSAEPLTSLATSTVGPEASLGISRSENYDNPPQPLPSAVF